MQTIPHAADLGTIPAPYATMFIGTPIRKTHPQGPIAATRASAGKLGQGRSMRTCLLPGDASTRRSNEIDSLLLPWICGCASDARATRAQVLHAGG